MAFHGQTTCVEEKSKDLELTYLNDIIPTIYLNHMIYVSNLRTIYLFFIFIFNDVKKSCKNECCRFEK